ncbi:MAG: homing endonuclease associated repeat-containing protein [Blastocatellia bacterium]
MSLIPKGPVNRRVCMPAKPASRILKLAVITHLQDLASELKRTPMTRDIKAAGRRNKCLSPHTIRNVFGNFSNALRAARLPLNKMQEFSELELISQLQDLSAMLGRPLVSRDVHNAARNGTCARLATFKRVFGSTTNAFRSAGVQSVRRFSESELIGRYRALSKELGRPARIADIDLAASEGQFPGYETFKTICGGLTNVRRLAGLLHGASKRYTRDGLLNQLKSLARKLGRTPTAADIYTAAARGEIAGLKTFQSYFGGHNKALREAGMSLNKQSGFSRGGLIADLQQLARELGKRPSMKDVDRASQTGSCPCSATYAHYFGSFSSAVKAARLDGLPVAPRTRWRDGQPVKYSKAEILTALKTLAVKLGRTPTFSDVADASKLGECPNTTTIARNFGRLSTAFKEAGFDSGERKRKARQRLIGQLQQLTRELRRIPTSADISAAQGRCSTPMTFVRNFGSMVEARKAARVAEILMDVGAVGKTPRVGEKFERDALIQYMQTLANLLGKVPSYDDVRKACRERGGPGVRAFVREFGSIPAARRAARIE